MSSNTEQISFLINLINDTEDYGSKIDRLLEEATSPPETLEALINLIELGNNKPLTQVRNVNLLMMSGHISKARHFVDPTKTDFFI